MQILKTKRKPKKRDGRSRKGEGSIYLRGRTYWYKIPSPGGGKPICGSCETADYDEALIFKNKRLVEAHARRRKPAGTATVNEILDDYEKYVEADKPKSYRSIRTALAHLRAIIGTKVADNLTTEDAEEFRTTRESGGCRFTTVNRELGYLRAALAREMKTTPPRVTSIPFMRVPSEKSQVREGFIERADYQKILAELPDSLRAIFVCAFHTGARSGELKKIKWGHVNFKGGIIELAAKNTKNTEGRWLPIWGDMEQYLKRQKAVRDRDFPRCEYVFFWMHGYHQRAIPGTPLRDFRFAWRESCERAGYPKLLFHDLRRSAIKYADQEAGISQDLVRLMSGHKTPSIYSRYNIRGGRDIQKVGKSLDAFLKGSKPDA